MNKATKQTDEKPLNLDGWDFSPRSFWDDGISESINQYVKKCVRHVFRVVIGSDHALLATIESNAADMVNGDPLTITLNFGCTEDAPKLGVSLRAVVVDEVSFRVATPEEDSIHGISKDLRKLADEIDEFMAGDATVEEFFNDRNE